MTLLTEQPIRLALLCLIAVVAATVYYVQTRRPAALKTLIGVVVASILLLAMERLIETDHEAITRLLYAAAEDVAKNDRIGLIERLSPSAADLRRLIEANMPGLHFDDARITTAPEIRAHPTADPPAATATFRARTSLTIQGSPVTMIPSVEIRLVREADGWRIQDANIRRE